MTISKEPKLIVKGSFNSEWCAWYRSTHSATEAQAREELKVRINGLPEPPLATASGKPNPTWIVWYRSRNAVGGKAAENVCKAKMRGDYEPRKDLCRRIDSMARTLERQEARARKIAYGPVFRRQPWIMLLGKRFDLDGRLGNGEKTVTDLYRTKLGKAALERIVINDPALTTHVQAMIDELENRN